MQEEVRKLPKNVLNLLNGPRVRFKLSMTKINLKTTRVSLKNKSWQVEKRLSMTKLV